MKNNEDKILSEAVEIAVSQPKLDQTDMVDIVQQSTGVSFSIAEKAIEQATETVQQTQKGEIADKSSANNEELYRPLILAAFNFVMLIIALNTLVPMFIGDRNIIDVFQNTNEEAR